MNRRRRRAQDARQGNRRWWMLLLVALPGLITLWLVDRVVPGHHRFVAGTVVTFDTTASKSAVWYGVTVDLDDGGVVHASNPMKATTPVGARVELSESTGWLSGIPRYRLQRRLPE